MSNEGLKPEKLAVLIDADNTTAACAQDLLEEIAKYGIASVKRIYGDWSSPMLSGWRSILLKHALVPIQQFAYTKGKDATDMGLIIDAMDLLYSGHFDGFCLVSSDSDFTPLASRIRAAGRVVYGFGRAKTPEAFRQACDRFFYIENLGEVEKSKDEIGAASTTALADRPEAAKVTAKSRQMDAATKSLLNKSIKDATDEATGWAFVGKIGNVISETRPDFDSRTYGYAKLSGMLRDLRGLQFRTDEANRMYCRKIPYSDLIKLLDEAFNKFKSAKGWASLDVVGKYVKPRWDWQEYGFESFPELLGKVDHVEITNDGMRMLAPAAS
ncbi:NYN domain-containing protein [Ottowia sp.]|uniref:NYN domain-containing protein n=1 Tax=Ottowia sp. TaxID=1898956 RepID=UPI002604BD7F|nr:NYN domain-containing protein [Ottowia sp.]